MAIDTQTAPIEDTAPAKSPLATVAPPSKSAKSPLGGSLNDMITQHAGNLEASKGRKKEIIDSAITNLQDRLTKSQAGPSAEELLRISAAFAAPTKTGGFAESLGNVAGAGADILKGRRESTAGIQDLMQKYQLQGEDLDTAYMDQLLKAKKELGGAQSNYGKQAMDEGLQPGTPEFAKRVQQLSKIDTDIKQSKAGGAEAGSFDKKTGNYITPSGVVIKASEVGKDREKIQALSDLQNRLGDLSPKKLKNAESFFDQTTGIGKAIGSRLGTKAFKAQTEIQASGIQEVLNNLPPGPASDKDIAQAKSSFPGYSDAGALKEWVERTEKMIARKQEQFTNKYGSESWWGESGSSGAAAKKPGEKPAEGEKKADAKPAPKVGAVMNGHRFKGGDPAKKENWEPV